MAILCVIESLYGTINERYIFQVNPLIWNNQLIVRIEINVQKYIHILCRLIIKYKFARRTLLNKQICPFEINFYSISERKKSIQNG